MDRLVRKERGRRYGSPKPDRQKGGSRRQELGRMTEELLFQVKKKKKKKNLVHCESAGGQYIQSRRYRSSSSKRWSRSENCLYLEKMALICSLCLLSGLTGVEPDVNWWWCEAHPPQAFHGFWNAFQLTAVVKSCYRVWDSLSLLSIFDVFFFLNFRVCSLCGKSQEIHAVWILAEALVSAWFYALHRCRTNGRLHEYVR